MGYNRKTSGKVFSTDQRLYSKRIKEIGANGAPKTAAEFRNLKTTNPKEYFLIRGYERAVKTGNISPLIGLGLYKEIAQEIEAQLVGLKCSNGITVTGYAYHFIDRIIGQSEDDHPNKRRGVKIGIVKNTLTTGVPEPIQLVDGLRSQRFIGKDCLVCINPDTGVLIQANPRRKGGA